MQLSGPRLPQRPRPDSTPASIAATFTEERKGRETNGHADASGPPTLSPPATVPPMRLDRVRTVFAGACTALLLVATPSHAQPHPRAADEAAQARRLVSAGLAALRAGDTVGAHRNLVKATELWPTQPAYQWTRAQLAAAAGDTAAAAEGVTNFAALGASRSLTSDPFLAKMATNAQFGPALIALLANAEPRVRSSVRATLADSTLWPEGVAWDARGDRFFVGSVRHRMVYVHDARGTRALWAASRADIGAILGVALDPDGVHLWATTSGLPQMNGYVDADSGIAALLKFRITDGTIVQRWDLPPSAAGHTLGDVTVTPMGDVFMTDSREPVLYRLRRGRAVMEAYRDPEFRSLQGVAPAPDGQHVYVADYSHGLLRVDLATNAVIRLSDARSSTSLGVDGLVWFEGSLIGVQNGITPPRIVRFHLDESGTSITRQEVLDRNTAIADEPTIGVIAGRSYVYVANSQWDKHDDHGKRVPGSVLAPTVLLSVPLK